VKTNLYMLALGTILAFAGEQPLQAQGTIQFFNSALSKLKYDFGPGTVAVDAPAGVVVGIYWGTSPDNLRLEPRPWTIVIPGLFGSSTATGVYPLTGTNPGETVFLQVRGWHNRDGMTPMAADQRIFTPGITHYGESAVIETTALGPVAGPGTVIWQGPTGVSPNRAKPFVVTCCPEPSTWALAGLGLGVLWLRRRPRGEL
jgi:hypothetical protein